MSLVAEDSRGLLRRKLNLDSAAVVAAALKRSDLRAAAVLVPIVDRPSGLSVVLTRRADHLSAHAGQVSFPGGRIDPGDADPIAAALREAEEEIGLDPAFAEPIGILDPVETGTGFRIAPVIAFIRPIFDLTAHPSEVALIFEAPLDHLMNPQQHQLLEWHEGPAPRRTYYAISYDGHNIWGATARILVDLYEKVFR